MFVNPRLLPSLFFLAAFSLVSPAHADGLDAIMAAKVIKIAVPQDFAPFGSAGLDLKPQGYDIDMANLIAKALGREGRAHPGDQRQPHSLSADQQGRPRHLQPRQERRAREGDRLLHRLCAVLLRRVRHQGHRGCDKRGRSQRQDHRRHARRHRGAGIVEDRAGRRHHQALRGQQRHHLRLRLRARSI